MRAAIVPGPGRAPELGEFDEPAWRDDHEVVRVTAAALNPFDRAIAAGAVPGARPDPPYVLGQEGAGLRANGVRVYFRGPVERFGSCAERTLVPTSDLIRLPPEVDDVTAAGLGIAGAAAWLALTLRGRLAAGEHVLVLGASGPVGQVAVQVARHLGAGRVVAAARSPEGLERARELGADATVQLSEDGWPPATPTDESDGFDLVVDPLWGRPIEGVLDAMRPGGRIVQVGQSAGAEASIPAAPIRARGLSIVGHAGAVTSPEERRDAYRRLLELAAAGELVLDTATLDLADVAEAWERLGGAPHRKLVLIP